MFEVMHVCDIDRVEVAACQLKSEARTLFDQWKEGRFYDAPPPCWDCFNEAFLGRLFARKLKEAMVWSSSF